MSLVLVRPEVEEKLYAFIKAGSGLVVGDPGVGKSFGLRQSRARLVNEKNLVRLVPIDRVGSTTRKDVLEEIGFKGDWAGEYRQKRDTSGCELGILIFDSFDSLRNAEARRVWLGIIREAVRLLAGISWRVVVSCRTYDAEKSVALKAIFKDHGHSTTPFVVPGLSKEELNRALSGNAGMYQAHQASSEQLRELFRIPFYLILIAELIESGTRPDQFATWHSAGQLLRAIFAHRFEQHGDEARLVRLLQDLTRTQVDTMSLVTDWTKLREWSGEAADALASEGIIEKGDEHARAVKFSHNIFFDFATAEYLIPVEPREFLSFIAAKPERQLFLRPSLQFYLSDIFSRASDRFWSIAEHAVANTEAGLAPLSRVIVPSVAVSEANSEEQLNELFRVLETQSQEGNDLAICILRALRVDLSWLKSEIRLPLWLKVLVRLGNHLHVTLAWDIGMILDLVWNEVKSSKDDSLRASCGELARKLLEWEWRQREAQGAAWHHGTAAAWAIPLVCKTYAQDCEGSKALLTKVLRILGEKDFSIECLYRLCDQQNVINIILADPDFAVQIYQGIFSLRDPGEGTITQGIIVPLTISRKDEFHMCQWNLVEIFPRFLQSHPVKATEALIVAVEGSAYNDHVAPSMTRKGMTLADLERPFKFRGHNSAIVTDLSHIWDETMYPQDAQRLLHEMDGHLRRLAEQDQEPQILAILEVYGRKARFAVLWKHLIEVGALFPELIGLLLVDLCIAEPVLLCSDTTYEAGQLIRALIPHLSLDLVRAVEEAVLRLRHHENSKYGEYIRNRLLKVIGDRCVLDESKAILSELSAEPLEHENRPLFSHSETFGKAVTKEMWLSREGVDVNQSQNEPLSKMSAALEELNRKEPKPSVEEYHLALLEQAKRLAAELNAHPLAHKKVVDWAETEVAIATEKLIKHWNGVGERDKEFLRERLIAACESENPEFDEKYHAEWKSAAWSSAPRNSAAQALPWFLMRVPQDLQLIEKARLLAKDEVPTVRFLFAAEAWQLKDKNLDLLIELLGEYVKSEMNATVLDAVCMSIQNASEYKEVRGLLPELYRRMSKVHEPEEDEHVEFRKAAITMMVDQELRGEEEWPAQVFETWRSDPLKYAREIFAASIRLSQWCEPLVDEKFVDKALQRQMAFIDSCLDKLLKLIHSRVQLDDEARKQSQIFFRMIDNVVSRVYFACNFDQILNKQEEEAIPLSDRKAVFKKCIPLLQLLTRYCRDESGILVPSTAHHFMQLLRGAVEYGASPKVVLEMAYDVAAGGDRLKYALDRMSVDEVVKLVEIVVSDHRHEIVQDANSMKALIGLLDIFARVGWPDALKMIWRLDEMYR